jgi:flavin reductase
VQETPLFREKFLEGMSRAASTVSVVTTNGVAGRAGVTVSAMSAVSADSPTPSLLVCVNASNAVAQAIEQNEVFCVNVLRYHQSRISDTFASRIRTPSGDKFDCGEWGALRSGAPVLCDALVAFDCFLRTRLAWGSHLIFIGELADVAMAHPSSPLIYANRAYGTPVPLDEARLRA